MTTQFDKNQLILTSNDTILTFLSKYLNFYSDYIKENILLEIVNECNVSVTYAYAVLLAAAFDLDMEEKVEDNFLFNEYFIPMLNELENHTYYDNLYYKNIIFPDITSGTIKLGYEIYQPYEAFVCNDMITTSDGKVIPQIGFFKNNFKYPAILENDRIWMTITPNEIETMVEPVHEAFGHVLTFGLGLGYYPYMVSMKDTITSITIVEKNKDIIELFKLHILPQFSNAHKVIIIEADAFDYASKGFGSVAYDYIFTDLWHDVSDGIDMYFKMKSYESLCSSAKFTYWIEKSMLCYM